MLNTVLLRLHCVASLRMRMMLTTTISKTILLLLLLLLFLLYCDDNDDKNDDDFAYVAASAALHQFLCRFFTNIQTHTQTFAHSHIYQMQQDMANLV